LNFTPQFGLGVRWDKPGLIHLRNTELIEQTEKQEASRLLYVAMTRAEEHLVLSWSQKPKKPKVWAKVVSDALQLEARSSGVHTCQGPGNKPFDVSLLRTAEGPNFIGNSDSSRGISNGLAIPPPVLREQFEQNTTASALSQFATCPRKYYLGNYLGWDGDMVRSRATHSPSSSRSGSSLRANEIGTEVHRLLADVPVEHPNLESIRLARVFESSSYGKRAARAKTRGTEWDFVFAFEDLILRGTIDLWFEDAQGLTLIDYKTDDVTSDHAGDRARDYSLQLDVYALALTRALGKPPNHALLYFLRPDLALPVSVAEADRNVSRVSRDFVAAQERMNFPLNVGPHCRRCEFFRNICPAKLASVDAGDPGSIR
jgi:ATP-dependent exoDNAse (exonuclease V) beta subunit